MVNYFKKPGRNIEMLENMRKQAQELNISEAGCCGYITFDEMSVQASVWQFQAILTLSYSVSNFNLVVILSTCLHRVNLTSGIL